MRLLDLTLETPEENLALDEALLVAAEEGAGGEVLRLWEPAGTMVVVGSSSRVEKEVQLAACQKDRIPVLRRSSGGAAIVTGPGCLMYAVVLDLRLRPDLRAIDRAHRHVLNLIAGALGSLVPNVARRGTSDLAIADRKFSGNSLRVKRDHLLYHGTLLYDFALSQIAAYLATPPRQPEYRAGREHADFVTNLPLSSTAIRDVLIHAFDAVDLVGDWPQELTKQLAADKFANPAWTHRF
jgi:lipoate-protein ligase A